MRLKSYWLLCKGTFQESFSYKRNTVTGMMFGFVTLLIRIAVWQALYAEIGGAPLMGRTLGDMLTYTIVITIVQAFTDSGRVAELLEERMKSGEIAVDFLRPISPRGMLVARTWGDKLLEILCELVPIAAGIALLGGISLPGSPLQFCFFLLALALGYLVNLMFAFVTASFAFWFVSVTTLNWFIRFFTVAMSGVLVPLWLLPDWLRVIAKALPFQAITYVPASIFMGSMDLTAFRETILVQLLWIAALGALQSFLWRRGKRRIIVHGG